MEGNYINKYTMKLNELYRQPECNVHEVVTEGILCGSIQGEHSGYSPDDDNESYF